MLRSCLAIQFWWADQFSLAGVIPAGLLWRVAFVRVVLSEPTVPYLTLLPNVVRKRVNILTDFSYSL